MSDAAALLPGTDYVPPQRMFWRCQHCQAVVLKTKEGLVTPLLGYKHVCGETATKSHHRQLKQAACS